MLITKEKKERKEGERNRENKRKTKKKKNRSLISTLKASEKTEQPFSNYTHKQRKKKKNNNQNELRTDEFFPTDRLFKINNSSGPCTEMPTLYWASNQIREECLFFSLNGEFHLPNCRIAYFHREVAFSSILFVAILAVP